MKIKAYAKMNLALGVKGVLENGYHDLFMLNTKINLFDIIYIRKAKEDKLIMDKDLCSMESNIGYKALKLVKEQFNIKNNYYIRIKKNIPSGAGLGGGSADAASIIKAILKLEKIDIKNEDLIPFATKLGADVPYCLYNDKCFVTGLGDKIEITKDIKDYKVLLVSPAISISTKSIFENCNTNDCGANIERIMANKNNVHEYLFNDLEIAAKKVYPDYKLDEIKQTLKENGALTALMTGSGSSIFGLFDINDKDKINKCKADLISKYKNINVRKLKTISY